MNFQIKVLAAEPDGYKVEWRYAYYSTFEAEYAMVFNQFLLKTPFQLKLSKKGELVGWLDKAILKKKFQAFFIEESNKPHSTLCLDTINSIMNLEDEQDFLQSSMPEISHFFWSFSLLPAEIHYQKDTVEVFKDYILDFTTTITLPRIISAKAATTFSNSLEVNFTSHISESHLKKYVDDHTRASWDKLGIEKGNEMRKDLEAQLEAFQPKKGISMYAVFDKTNGSVIQFDYAKEDLDKMKGGESEYYYFSRK